VARMKTRGAVSAGGVVFTRRNGALAVVVAGQLGKDVWRLPKGAPRHGESLEETAVREVSEETGLDVQIIAPAGQIEYWFVQKGMRVHKVVHYYAMRAVGGDMSRHDWENDVVEALPVDEALERLTYENERQMVTRALDVLQAVEGGLETIV